ncbi:hypothetical protein PHYC_03665 [Phycisphaerales bacterium]|nr:hypothetical protein PHYC_03665 [Phycisphaerales bacterium]
MARRTPHVRSYEDSGFEALEQRQVLAGDFAVSVGALFNDFDRRADAQVIRLTATVNNVGTLNYRGRASMEFYLSADDSFDVADDFLFETKDLRNLPRIGGRMDVRLDTVEPALVDPPAPLRHVAPGEYFVVARLVLDNSSFDTNTANNHAMTFASAVISYEFGILDAGRNRPFTYTQSDGTKVTIKIDRIGTGNLDLTEDGIVLVVTGAEPDASLMISTDRDRPVHFAQINLPQGIKAVKAQRVTLSGILTIQGFISRILLGKLDRGSITIQNGFGRGVTIEAGDVRDAVITSNLPIDALNVRSWRDTDGTADFLRAPFISNISSGGDFAPSVTVTSFNSNSMSIDRFVAKGNVSGVWSLARGVEIWEAGSTTASFRANIAGVVENFRTRGDMRGTLASPLMFNIDIGGSLISGRILAGYNLGADLEIGGTGSNADQARNGSLDTIRIRRDMTNSIVASGLRTTDNILLDDDDTLVTSPAGAAIGHIEVGRRMQNSFFVSPILPGTARVNNRTVTVADDTRFADSLPLPAGVRFLNPSDPPPPSGGSSGGSGGGSGGSGNDSPPPTSGLSYLRSRGRR